jgi:hypothetical protein
MNIACVLPFDVFDDLLARAFTCSDGMSHVPLLLVTMSQKHSLIKSLNLDP